MERSDLQSLRAEFDKVEQIMQSAPSIDTGRSISSAEFEARQRRTWEALERAGFEAGFVFSDEHYNGDVPYLGGNTNIMIEQIAGVIGPQGFHFIAGLEGGYVVEQLAPRAHAPVHKVEMLQLAGEDYPIAAESPQEVFVAACGRMPRRVALLSPREVVPVMLVDFLARMVGAENVIDAQPIYQKIKYEKSDAELDLTKDACAIADLMLRAMLAVLKPGMRETQVAAWGDFVAKELGAEEMGWDIMVTANTANRTLIGKALNRTIRAGDMVQLGVAPKRDGLTACVRRSVVALEPGQSVTLEQRFWIDLICEAYRAGHRQFVTAALDNLPASTIEEAIVDYLAGRSKDVSRHIGRPIDLVRQKPYSSVHNGGYTECQEFYGAVTLSSHEPLGRQIVNMLDVALRGCGNHWDEIVIPGLDYIVVENTFGKRGPIAEPFGSLPEDCQPFVGCCTSER